MAVNISVVKRGENFPFYLLDFQVAYKDEEFYGNLLALATR